MSGSPQQPAVDRAIRAVVLLVVVAAAGYLGWAAYLGWRELGSAALRLGLAAMATGLALASVNYLLRYLRWRDLLQRLGHRVPDRDGLRVYLAGLALTATPGKSGETIRSALLLRWQVPVSASLTAFVVDRLTDVIGVLLLAALSGSAPLWWVLAALAAGAGLAVRTLCRTSVATDVAAWFESRRWTSLGRLLHAGMQHYATAWRLDRIAMYVGIAILAYGVQALAFAWFALRLWPEAQWHDSVHVYATSTLAGAASLLPGGLGAMEIALIAQMTVRGMPLSDATVAALAVRAVTLWFAIFLGLACLLWYRRHASEPTHS